ncbi:MAG: alpha/beta hydrolase [Candidatus Wallbacteria bacterium]|nr:alpha/beta hydrolase [Candidatus Wallbacteria bacterium]
MRFRPMSRKAMDRARRRHRSGRSTRDSHVLDLGRFGYESIGLGLRVQLHLPADYEEDHRPYPLLYMLDGQNVFDRATSFLGQAWDADKIHDALVTRGLVEPFVIATIGSGAERDFLYTPSIDPIEGGGQLALMERLILGELDPWLRNRFRLLHGPQNTGILGSSLGGLAAFHLAWDNPDRFGLVGMMSPSLWWDRNVTHRLVEADEGGPDTPLRIWLDVGTEEDDDDEDDDDADSEDEWLEDFDLIQAVVDLGEALEIRGHDVRTTVAEGAEHTEAAWRERLPGAFLWLFGERE